jgi:SAM-dependent methyltransferase
MNAESRLREREFQEPFRSRFLEQISVGAASQDIHDAPVEVGFAAAGHSASRAFVQREIDRPHVHVKNICQYIAGTSASRILDVGCGTAGLSVALAWTFPSARIESFDADGRSVQAGMTRIAGYGMSDRVHLQVVAPGAPFPFETGSFDLVTCTSVIEFITNEGRREKFLSEIRRMVRPGGTIVITTPNPFYPVELHSHRLFQNWRRELGYPWAPTQAWLRRQLKGCVFHSYPERIADKLRGHFHVQVPLGLAGLVSPFLRWQFIVAQVPPAPKTNG